MLLLLQVRSKF